MSSRDRAELGMAFIVAAVVWLAGPARIAPLRTSYVVLGVGALLLLQSLLRDLWILWRRRATAAAGEPQAGRYFCVESAVGLLAVVCGALLLTSRMDSFINLDRRLLSTLVLAALCIGFLIKDWVIQANPWRIVREQDHLNLVVRWRR